MGAFVSSMLGSAVVLAVMYLVYRWAISGTSDHGFNRGVLIAIYLLAFAVCPLWDSLSFPLPGAMWPSGSPLLMKPWCLTCLRSSSRLPML